MKVNCLIIDDEVIAQEIIESYIEPLDKLVLVGKCKNAIEANNILNSTRVDLLFLDIEMPHINGLAFLKNLSQPPQVIITTAYRDYALEGFELNVSDYLLKPISHERFLKAVNRVLSKAARTVEEAPYIYLKVDMKMVQVFLNDIMYIQGLSNYVRIFCRDRVLISYQKLSHLEEVLPADKFVRSHRSYIVNASKISAYTAGDITIGNTELPIGASHKDKLLAFLSRYQT